MEINRRDKNKIEIATKFPKEKKQIDLKLKSKKQRAEINAQHSQSKNKKSLERCKYAVAIPRRRLTGSTETLRSPLLVLAESQFLLSPENVTAAVEEEEEGKAMERSEEGMGELRSGNPIHRM